MPTVLILEGSLDDIPDHPPAWWNLDTWEEFSCEAPAPDFTLCCPQGHPVWWEAVEPGWFCPGCGVWYGHRNGKPEGPGFVTPYK